jgi:hypothetical protein
VIKLRITEEQFNELYPDMLGRYAFFDEPVPVNIEKQEFEKTYLKSKLWRLNNVYKVINKDGEPVVFRMNYAQHRVYAATRIYARVIILKSRQQGISTFWLVSFFDDAVFCPFLTLGLMAQGNDEASTLLERAKFLWDNLSSNIKAYLNVRLTKDNTKEFGFSNDSKMFIRVSFRSATLQRLHISELGKIANANPKRAKETKTGTLQALGKGNTGVIESTAEGRNMFKDIWDASILALHSGQMAPKDFYPVFLSWLDDPDCVETIKQTLDSEALRYFKNLEIDHGRVATVEQKNFWVVQRRELAGDLYQEYPATPEEAFLASRDGTYYSRAFNEKVVRKNQVVADLYDPNIPVDIFFDLGVDDYTVMGFTQWYRKEYRIVHEYWNNGFGIGHYLDYAFDTGLDIRDIVLPHDAEQRGTNTAGSGRAKSTKDIAKEHIKLKGYNWGVRVLPRSPVSDGIEAVRRMLPMLWLDVSCTYTVDCLNNYSKDFDEKLQVWKLTPKHDEFSHGADMLRQVAMGVREHASSNDSSQAIPDRYKPNKHTGFAI